MSVFAVKYMVLIGIIVVMAVVATISLRFERQVEMEEEEEIRSGMRKDAVVDFFVSNVLEG